MLSNLSLFYLTKSINVKFRKKKMFDFSYATYVYREKMTKENSPPPLSHSHSKLRLSIIK